ncbi:MAG: hypothetical protein K6A94_10550 [Bacteroidales bacterium]|nr:hypothetical protein [Bacteroidales bacterium]
METRELEEMKVQLAVLNGKLENERIVDERLLGEATKKHLSELQRKLIGRIVIFGVLTPIFSYFLGLYFGLWCLGITVLCIYVYRMTRQTYSTSVTVAEYIKRIRKALKTYKKANKFMWIFSISFITLFSIIVATSMSIDGWSSRGIEGALGAFLMCFLIILVLLVTYFISNVYVSPKVELMLEQVLEDLGKDNQEAK